MLEFMSKAIESEAIEKTSLVEVYRRLSSRRPRPGWCVTSYEAPELALRLWCRDQQIADEQAEHRRLIQEHPELVRRIVPADTLRAATPYVAGSNRRANDRALLQAYIRQIVWEKHGALTNQPFDLCADGFIAVRNSADVPKFIREDLPRILAGNLETVETRVTALDR